MITNARLRSSIPLLRLYREISTSDWPLPRVTSTAKAGGAAQRSSAVAMVADCSVGLKQRDTLKHICAFLRLPRFLHFALLNPLWLSRQTTVFPIPNHYISRTGVVKIGYASFVQRLPPKPFCFCSCAEVNKSHSQTKTGYRGNVYRFTFFNDVYI